MAVFLYKVKEYIRLTKTGDRAPNMNYPMINYDTKLYLGVDNTLDFWVRNMDRQNVNLVGCTLRAVIERVDSSDYSASQVVLTKELILTDDRNGKAQLLLSESDMYGWSAGYYSYMIQSTDDNGNTTYFCTDVNKSAIGFFELLPGISGSLQPSQEFISHDYQKRMPAPALGVPLFKENRQAGKFTPMPIGDYGIIYTTGAIPGDARTMQTNGTHTVAIYSENWIGKFWIQVSLDNNAPVDYSDWYSLPLTSDGNTYFRIDKTPKIKTFTFFGNYTWVRFLYQDDPQNTGYFLKILYKR